MTITPQAILLVLGVLVLMALAGGELGGAFWLMDKRNHVLDAPDFGTRFNAGCASVVILLILFGLCSLAVAVLRVTAADCPINFPDCGPDTISITRFLLPVVIRP